MLYTSIHAQYHLYIGYNLVWSGTGSFSSFFSSASGTNLSAPYLAVDSTANYRSSSIAGKTAKVPAWEHNSTMCSRNILLNFCLWGRPCLPWDIAKDGVVVAGKEACLVASQHVSSVQAVEGFRHNICNVSVCFNEKQGFKLSWDGSMDAQFSGTSACLPFLSGLSLSAVLGWIIAVDRSWWIHVHLVVHACACTSV